MNFRCVLLLCVAAGSIRAQNSYSIHNLVSDVPELADQTDANLKNPWGLAASATSPFWVTNNHSGTSTVYNSDGAPFPSASPLIVPIPVPQGENLMAAPTGVAFNDTMGFELQAGAPATFLFASEDGTISAWSNKVEGGNARIVIDNSASKAVYKGLTVASTPDGPRLYAANFRTGAVDTFDSNFRPVSSTDFGEPLIPGYAPFNIQRIGQRLFVTYAKQSGEGDEDLPGAGNGFVLTFTPDGKLMNLLAGGGALNSPWGLAMAPDYFGDFAGALLVGNFGDGKINAYDSCSGSWLGALNGADGKPLQVPGLWALRFGNGHNGGEAGVLYVTAGIAQDGDLEDHGLFGSIRLAPPAAPAPANTEVAIQSLKFLPDTITIQAGSSIVWSNKDGFAHTVKADGGQFSSPLIDGDGSFSQTFTKPGAYDYHCTIHPFMRGKVVVQ
ncbi:MAG: TIGR03118 family protein [Bryobacterales bacterium]|nr:TIGR03118 family protein [Bryobacterales bacterium]